MVKDKVSDIIIDVGAKVLFPEAPGLSNEVHELIKTKRETAKNIVGSGKIIHDNNSEKEK